MEEALELARAKDTKERMAGVEQLHQLLEASRKSLSSSEVSSLVDVCLDLLKDNNFRISQGGLQALSSAAVLSGEHLKLHFNALLPAIVERLGDAKQPVRDAARTLLLTLMEVSSPTIIVERAGNHAWAHKSWRVKEEFAHTVTTSINLYASTELPLQRAVLPHILQMLNDSNHGVREAAILCIEEMYTQIGHQFRDELQRHYLPISMAKDINSRLDKIEPNVHSSNGLATIKVKPAVINPKKSSPRNRSSPREGSLFGGDGDHTEKPVEPIKVYSEKELIREFEKIFSILVPEKDWSVRILAMQRVEALVIGGATEYPCFRGLLKQLIDPLSTQVSDRRSSIVKQACHLLCFLSKELPGDFEACAEMFIPVLFKLVVITVLVIAESADNCIKTILRNCKVVRSLPRIADSAKNDRSAILRARCCEYAILILEYWADAPEIKRSADLYEDLIKCCVADSMSEVRSTARACFKVFAKTWPERSRRLLMSFDPVIQRVINEEDGGIHRRHVSISERVPHMTSSSPSKLASYGSSPIIAMDRTASLPSPKSHSSGLFSSVNKSSERSLESVLHSSKEKVSAIESMLRGLNISEKTRSASFDLGADRPSSRDPLFPASTSDTTPKRNSGLKLSDIITQIQASKDSSNKSSYRSNIGSESAMSASSSYSRKNVPNPYLGTPYKDNTNHNNYVPNFQRPLSRKNVPARVSTNRRRSFEDNHVSYTDVSRHVEGPGSLNDALSQGLSSSSDWNTRVASFNYLQSLLQQGSRGVHEITQSFEKVMKLFFQHLDDPHHKVAQAALSTLAELIPVCKKPFESYMERILPHVFSRLIDPKELVRQPCTKTLEIIAKTYSVDSQLPALLRSLDEQRSPKAKLAVIEFAITSLNKHLSNSEGSNNVGILKLWLAKLTSSVHDKNTKLKEASIMCIIAVYTHYDPTTVLNFILSLSVEEQNSLRRALKQYTPRIEVDLMNFIQNKKDKQRVKSSYDLSSNAGTSSEEGYIGVSKKTHFSSDRKWSSQSLNSFTHQTANETRDHLYSSFDNGLNTDILSSKAYDLTHGFDNMEVDNDELLYDSPLKANSPQETGLSIPQILHIIGNGSDGNPEADKHGALKQLIEISIANDQFIWSKYFNQILTAVLEVLSDTDSSIRELDLSFIYELLKNQKDAMEDSVELVVEKLLHVTKDIVPNVSNEAEHCLTLVLSQYNPFKCLSVIVPLLQTEDEKTLVTCINCLTKLVERLSQEELMAQLPSFLPALFDAFGNQSTDVRKSVVFCLVDIYIMLGKTFLPYLEGLNSTQLRLVTIYANRISQSRTGTPIDATHD